MNSRPEKSRTPLQQEILNIYGPVVGEEFVEATDHSYTCRCPLCLHWWVTVGPEDIHNDVFQFGPFSWVEILATGGVTEARVDYWNELFDSDVQLPTNIEELLEELNSQEEALKQRDITNPKEPDSDI